MQFHSPISGGVKRFINDKCRYLADRPHIEHLVIVPSLENGRSVNGRSIVREIASPRLIGSVSYRLLLNEHAITRILEQFRPHVIEVGDPYFTAWIGLKQARKLGAAHVSVYHSDYPRAWARTIRKCVGPWAVKPYLRIVNSYLAKLYRSSDALVTTTRHYQRMWTETGIDPVVRIPLGVNGDIFRPLGADASSQMRSEWRIPSSARVLLYVGRIAREKNPDFLIEAVRRVREQRQDLYLVFVGDGERRPVVEAYAERYAWLRWRPYVDSSDKLAEVYAAADVFVHAGVGETFGLGVVEAQSTGLPVVAFRHGALPETVLPSCDSVTIRPYEHDDFALGLDSCLNADSSIEARWARHHEVQAHFRWRQTFDQLCDLYELLRQGRRPDDTILRSAGRTISAINA